MSIFYRSSNKLWLRYYNKKNIEYVEILNQEVQDFSFYPNSKFSPIIFLEKRPENLNLKGNWSVVFLYNTSTTKVLQFYEDLSSSQKSSFFIALSWGLANIVVFVKNNPELVKRVQEINPSWEYWRLKNRRINNRSWDNHKTDMSIIQDIHKGVEKFETHEIKVAFEEYAITIKKIIIGCASYVPEYVDYFLRLDRLIIKSIVLNSEDLPITSKTDYLVSLNASLSRVYGQMFNGTSGILQNPCPALNHSLLGMGLANLALLKFCSFIESKIPEKSVKDLFESIMDLELDRDPDVNIDKRINKSKKIIERLRSAKKTSIPETIPIVPFFSGRDGFKYGKLTNVSVPLMCLQNANRYSWNLLTITHELSHLFTESIILILDEREEDDFVEKLRQQDYVTPKYGKTTYLYWALQLFYSSKYEIKSILNDEDYWDIKMQMSEILTHIVDFLFFYNGKTKAYFRYIWSSWLTVPELDKRLTWYIVRTGSAILSANLEKSREEFIKKTLISGFNSMIDDTGDSIFVKIINDYIYNEEKWKEIFSLIMATIPLIELVKVLIYDESLTGRIHRETRIKQSDSIYGFKLGQYSNSDINITNPIFFIKNYVLSDQENDANSLWILSKIAFCELNE